MRLSWTMNPFSTPHRQCVVAAGELSIVTGGKGDLLPIHRGPWDDQANESLQRVVRPAMAVAEAHARAGQIFSEKTCSVSHDGCLRRVPSSLRFRVLAVRQTGPSRLITPQPPPIPFLSVYRPSRIGFTH